MRIETINEIFTEAINKASKIAIKNPQNPILEYVHIEVLDSSTMQVSGYNLDTYVTQQVFIKTQEEVSKKAKEVISIYYKAYKQHDAENPGDHKESVREAYKKANKKFNEIIKENRKVKPEVKPEPTSNYNKE